MRVLFVLLQDVGGAEAGRWGLEEAGGDAPRAAGGLARSEHGARKRGLCVVRRKETKRTHLQNVEHVFPIMQLNKRVYSGHSSYRRFSENIQELEQ
jgi:hypothetical protein